MIPRAGEMEMETIESVMAYNLTFNFRKDWSMGYDLWYTVIIDHGITIWTESHTGEQAGFIYMNAVKGEIFDVSVYKTNN